MRKYLLLLLLLPFLFSFTWNGATISTWNGATISTWNDATAIPYTPINYLDDANIYGAYNFEDNVNDSNNVHTNNLSTSTVSYSASYVVKWGSKSGYFSSAAATISSANQSTGFPFKTSGTTAATMGGWIRTGSNVTDTQFPMGIADGIMASAVFDLCITGGELYGQIFYGSSDYKTTKYTVSASTNYFIAVTWDGSNIHLYVGTDSGSVSEVTPAVAASITPNTGKSFNIGALYGTIFPFLNGYVDQAFIFNRALSVTELERIRAHKIDGSS